MMKTSAIRGAAIMRTMTANGAGVRPPIVASVTESWPALMIALALTEFVQGCHDGEYLYRTGRTANGSVVGAGGSKGNAENGGAAGQSRSGTSVVLDHASEVGLLGGGANGVGEAEAGVAGAIGGVPSGHTASTGGVPAGGTVATGGTDAFPPSNCNIDSTAYGLGDVNPNQPCEACVPLINASDWTDRPDGSICGKGAVCSAGVCQAGCVIDAQFRLPGAANPNNPNLSCQPPKSPTTWSACTPGPCVQAIAAANDHSCALISGTVQCWGKNDSGQLGNNSQVDSPVPVVVQALESGVQAIAVAGTVMGGGFACALVGDAAHCWGNTATFMVGISPSAPSLRPILIPGLESGVSSIGLGFLHSCAVINSAAVCWGYDGQGQLGDGCTRVINGSRPLTQVLGLAAGVQEVVVGSYHSCALVNGSVQCWGENNDGELGDGLPVTHDGSARACVPVRVQGLPAGVQRISTGESHFTCALVNDSAWCWGANDSGQLGNNSTISSSVPVRVHGLESGVEAIAVGGAHACAVVRGAAVCWGDGRFYGELGNNSAVISAVPVQVHGFEQGVTAIASGRDHVCAIVDGSVRCWGANYHGQLGDGTTTTSPVPSSPVVFR